jgi:hypothetical protein
MIISEHNDSTEFILPVSMIIGAISMTDRTTSELAEKIQEKDNGAAKIPLPCPFCGKNPVIDNYKLRGVMFWRVGCINNNCCVDVETVEFKSGEDVIKAWNQRATLT